jgi:hypothetical protein
VAYIKKFLAGYSFNTQVLNILRYTTRELDESRKTIGSCLFYHEYVLKLILYGRYLSMLISLN